MAGNTEAFIAGVMDDLMTPALSKMPANFGVTSGGQPLGVMGDVVTFSGTPTVTGTWTFGSTRVFASGLPVITTVAGSATVTAAGSAGGPMKLVTPGQRVSAQ